MNKPNKEVIIGIMSGTSLDGVDLAACQFEMDGGQIKYSIIAAETIDYSTQWKNELVNAHLLGGAQLIELNSKLGNYLGEITNSFIRRNELKSTLISSHGHTILHQPDKGFTYQIGSGACIAATTGINTICDFRSTDIALGGQGAPLVPIGDKLLFRNYEACLNLGGIANISYHQNNKRIAFDICPVNMALNFFASRLNLDYDNRGEIASSGIIDKELLSILNEIHFYNQEGPKSLGKEWFEKHFLSVVADYEKENNIKTADILCTLVEHIAIQHSNVFSNANIKGPVLVTGGGALNEFLISRIKSNSNTEIFIPEKSLINYKEALIFALLGWLNIRNEINTLSSATGARKDSIGGAYYKGN